ncbi:hypothetical protein MXD62_13140 [Frankia sp. Mgl5]|uniref:hypothetical protein n=1 Tax=Frankia sp. Mgl5 TaxID=2933793 RepID=UPI0020102001|nr:hypothetical protein [Frankia sp. Mgl5]MCK9928106.1 hypothetical protein [Frankia sp. Mgl5]
MSVLDTTTVQDAAAELLLSGAVQIHQASVWGQSPQVAALIRPGDGDRRRPHAVTLKHGIWDCDAHRSSTCACCVAVQTVTAGARA